MGLKNIFSRERKALDGTEAGDADGVSPVASELDGNIETRKKQQMKLAVGCGVVLAASSFWIFGGDDAVKKIDPDSADKKTVSVSDMTNKTKSEQEWMPKTQVSKVDCAVVDGLCEVTAGSNLFYVDRSGRYLVIGRVYDMETRQDLTATRLLEINPDTLVGGAAKANAAPDRGDAPLTSADRPAVPTTPKHLSLAGLPKDGAIVWGNPQGKTVTVFSDFECGYCKALSNALVSLNVRVVERPISALGTRALSNQVYCAKDRVKALHSAYAREPLGKSATCDTSGLDANERFAKANGLQGTPVLVRGDGAVMEGFRSAELVASFIADSRS